jgi:putative glutamine amidotransferase
MAGRLRWPQMERPRIVVTLTSPERATDRETATLKNRRYLEAVERAGGTPVPLDDRTPPNERRTAIASMDGLVISGGPDLDPALYGEPAAGARDPDPGRDWLDTEALRSADERSLPVLGVCRGMQAINVLAGGSLEQHVDGHEGPAYPDPAALQHPINVVGGTRLASILGGAEAMVVNSYHHQAVTPDRLAPSLIATAGASHDGTHLVEALESRDPDRWLIGIQCHPERTESSSPVLERLWNAFVAAARDRRSRAVVEFR